MSSSENPYPPPAPGPAAPVPPWTGDAPPPPGYGAPMPVPPAGDRYARPLGPVGQIRSTGLTMLLFFVTLGIWSLVYYYQTHDEMKRHSGEGLGGPIALVIAILFGIVNPYLLSAEVGQLYERSGRTPPVTVLTALWFFPGMLIIVGPFIWFVRTNRALNEYWAGLGAR
ncbi:DUF4234 domain-containing protein [Blastococcus sp. URHD0036]|uniref:DUF4234 domain-containing protein n=1 Tax=Blastococcus sp. URHD0036 TaxID=1380356 RepID=UPI001E379B11|nr:DUF4234 domain-containing protein [Blastococcus sp. URHD0036]